MLMSTKSADNRSANVKKVLLEHIYCTIVNVTLHNLRDTSEKLKDVLCLCVSVADESNMASIQGPRPGKNLNTQKLHIRT